jgi:hypothetical protein
METGNDTVQDAASNNPTDIIGISSAANYGDERPLFMRIVAAYQRAIDGCKDLGDSMWNVIIERSRIVSNALLEGDINTLIKIYDDPCHYDLFYGFDNIGGEGLATLRGNVNKQQVYARFVYERLRLLAQAVGVLRLDNPEQPLSVWKPTQPAADEILAKLDELFGWRVDFPNPYPNEYGLKTSRGVANHRAFQCLYQAWQIKNLLKGIKNPSVVEIGAETGRTAYYVNRLGIKRYTIIDIPLTSATQAHFLSRALSPDAIRLYGETGNGIEILPPQAFFGGHEHLDLAVNADGLTEMDIKNATKYWQEIERRIPMFLSINHEVNQFTVHDLIVKSTKMSEYSRSQYWTRPGYVEEIVKIRRNRRWFGK